MTQHAASIPTLPPTSAGACGTCPAISAQFAEFEKRRSITSDIQDHLLDLYTWARGWPFAHIVELGVRSGNSTSAFLAALEVDRRGCLWSIDIADPQVPGEWHELPYWEFLKGDALSPEAMSWAPPKIEVLFIDLDPHSYEQTFAALSMWAPRVVPGGVILLHDTEYPQVDNRQTSPGGSEEPWTAANEWPVSRAVAHYCQLKGLEWRNKSGCFGLGIVRVR